MVTNGRFNVLAIAGPTCSGKTTIPKLLNEPNVNYEHIPRPTVWSFDEYDLFPSGSEQMEAELAKPTITNWEDPALFDEDAYAADLEKAKKGLEIVLTTRSRESLMAGEEQRVIRPTSINMVEGLFTLHDPRARALIDISFFIDLPEELMVERRLLAASRGGTGPWDNPDYIRTTMVEGTRRFVDPQREHASVILDGTHPAQDLADIVATHIFSLALLP